MLEPNTVVAKIGALGILGILLLAGNQFVLQPILDTYQENKEIITQSNARLQRYRTLVAEYPILAGRLEALLSMEAAGSTYLEGTSDALIAAELQDIASATIEIAGGEIKSVQTLPTVDVKDLPALRKAAVNLRFYTAIDGLAEALFGLETSEPLLFIDRLQVSVDESREGNDEAMQAPKLDVSLDIYGFARRPK